MPFLNPGVVLVKKLIGIAVAPPNITHGPEAWMKDGGRWCKYCMFEYRMRSYNP